MESSDYYFHVGFTGTRRQLRQQQAERLWRELLKINEEHERVMLHHGDCVGADSLVHLMVTLSHELAHWVTMIHPPEVDRHRAYCDGDYICPPQPYLRRNKEIARRCDILLATPLTDREQVRSGTWATIRYARKFGKPIVIIYPHGEVECEN